MRILLHKLFLLQLLLSSKLFFLIVICLMLPFAGLYCQTNTVTGNIFLDHNGDGINNSPDYPHPAIRVKVINDVNGNGSYDTGDKIVGVGLTDVNGDYTVTVNHTANTVVDTDILVTSDDVREVRSGGSAGVVVLSDFSLFVGQSYTGLRFIDLDIPAGATITSAYMTFTGSDNDPSGNTLIISTEDNVISSSYNQRILNDVTGRSYQTSTVSWTTGAVTTGGSLTTPSLVTQVQALISNNDWEPENNGIGFMLTPPSTSDFDLEFYSWDDDNANNTSLGPELHITYTLPAPTNSYLVMVCQDDIVAGAAFSINSDTTITTTNVSGGTNFSNIDYAFKSFPSYCYAIADNRSTGQPDHLVVFNSQSGASQIVGETGTFDIESTSFDPYGKVLYAVNADQFGSVNLATGVFTPIGAPIGTINGPGAATYEIKDIDGIAFDIDGSLWATERVGGSTNYDLLLKINPATGQVVPNTFGAGVDYVIMQDAGGTYLTDIDDIAVDPVTGILYGVSNYNSSSVMYDDLVQINKTTGVLSNRCTLQIGGGNLHDVEGFTFTNSGVFMGTTGKDNRNTTAHNSLAFVIDPATCTATDEVYVGAATDYEAVDCTAGADNELVGTVFIDDACDGDLDTGDLDISGAQVIICRDTDQNGVSSAADTPLDTIVTGSNGEFNFTSPFNIGYIVKIDISSTTAAGYTGSTEFYLDMTNSCGGETDTLQVPYCCPNVPTTTASATDPTCGDSAVNSDGTITLAGFTTEKYDMTTGSTYTGSATFATATAIPAGGVITNTLPNPSGSQDYTIRIFNGDCYIDRTVTLNEQTTCVFCVTPILAALTNESICENYSFTTSNITTSVTNGVTVNFQWYDNNGIDNPGTAAIAGQTTGILTALPTAPGEYSYQVTATDPTDVTCASSQTVDLIINDDPEETYEICKESNDTATLIADSALTGVIWYNSANQPVGSGNTVIIDQNTTGLADGTETFHFTATNADSCPTGSCCPTTIIAKNCCKENICLPVNITIIQASRD